MKEEQFFTNIFVIASLLFLSACAPAMQGPVPTTSAVAPGEIPDFIPTVTSLSATSTLISTMAVMPTERPGMTSPQSPATASPALCLDESAQSRALPGRETPLEVQFTSNGNIWLWDENNKTAEQVSNTGDAQLASFAPDKSVVAFTRGPLDGQPSEWQTDLWVIQRDGTNLRQLVSADQLHALAGEPSTSDRPYVDNIDNLTWIESAQTLGFEISRDYFEIGGCCDSGGAWKVNLDTGDVSSWAQPSPDSPDVPMRRVSPDGSQVALIDETTVSLMNADGSGLRESILSFTTFPHHEGGGVTYPIIQWAHDSQSLLAITFSGDLNTPDTTFTTWRIPLDGAQAQELHTFPAAFWVHLSPDQKYLTYIRVLGQQSNERELHLARFDGSRDITYANGSGLAFLGWHADSFHFIYHQVDIYRPILGGVCSDPVPLLETSDTPAFQIEWVDANRFLFIKGWTDSGSAELRLGQIGGPSILIGPFNGTPPHFPRFSFNLETAPLGQE